MSHHSFILMEYIRLCWGSSSLWVLCHTTVLLFVTTCHFFSEGWTLFQCLQGYEDLMRCATEHVQCLVRCQQLKSASLQRNEVTLERSVWHRKRCWYVRLVVALFQLHPQSAVYISVSVITVFAAVAVAVVAEVTAGTVIKVVAYS